MQQFGNDIANVPQPYSQKDSLYVLLSRGVYVHTITFIDHTEVVGPNSQQHFRKYWAKLGYDAATIDSPEIRQQELLLKEAIALVERIGLQFPGQWRTTYRTAQPSDIANSAFAQAAFFGTRPIGA